MTPTTTFLSTIVWAERTHRGTVTEFLDSAVMMMASAQISRYFVPTQMTQFAPDPLLNDNSAVI